jgi:hypothetical protein
MMVFAFGNGENQGKIVLKILPLKAYYAKIGARRWMETGHPECRSRFIEGAVQEDYFIRLPGIGGLA